MSNEVQMPEPKSLPIPGPDLNWDAETGYVDGWNACHEKMSAYAGARCAQETALLIGLLADIRKAAGDPTGRLDWPGLVAHVAALREEALTWRAIAEGEAELRGQADEEIDDLKAERDALAADARRYRWMRNRGYGGLQVIAYVGKNKDCLDIRDTRDLDAAIDAAGATNADP